MKTLTVIAKEWFDRVNGNSYFAGEILIDNKRVANMPFQYGYGNQYEWEAVSVLKKLGIAKQEYQGGLHTWAKENGYELLRDKQEHCLQRELKKYND